MSALFDQSYQPWTGHLQPRPFRFLALTLATVRNLLKRHLSSLVALGFLSTLFGIFPAFAIDNPDLGIKVSQVLAASTFLAYVFLFPVVGSGLVAGDLKHNALLMYFSKAITRVDYLGAKLVGATVLCCIPVVVPPLLAAGVGMYAMGDAASMPFMAATMFATLVGSLFALVTGIAVLMAISSCTKRTFLAGVGWVAIIAVSWIVSIILSGSPDVKWGPLLFIPGHVTVITLALMPESPALGGGPLRRIDTFGEGRAEMFAYSPWVSVGILTAIVVVCGLVVIWRTSNVEKRA